jgi:hypothetical protein
MATSNMSKATKLLFVSLEWIQGRLVKNICLIKKVLKILKIIFLNLPDLQRLILLVPKLRNFIQQKLTF